MNSPCSSRATSVCLSNCTDFSASASMAGVTTPEFTVRGRLTFTSHTSMEVMVNVDAEGIFSEHTRNCIPVLSALFVMVAVDSSGKAVAAPPLIYSTEEEEKLLEEGRARYEARKSGPVK